jgi:hypothetical protein
MNSSPVSRKCEGPEARFDSVCRGSVITSDGGFVAYRELNDAVGLTDMGADTLADATYGLPQLSCLSPRCCFASG